MATIVWQVIKTIQCNRVGEAADLLEERVYGNDPLPDIGRPFKAGRRKCRFGTDCNLAGYACRWSYTNPNYDPFACSSDDQTLALDPGVSEATASPGNLLTLTPTSSVRP